MTTQLDHDSRAFPPAAPADLNDARVIVDNDWSAFRSVETMADHWDRPGWVPGHRAYYWMLTFPQSPDLLAEAAHGQRAIDPFALDPVPGDGLHVTMNKIGSAGAVAPATVDRLARQADGASGGAFSIDAHPMAGSRGSIRFSLAPWEPLVRLHAALAVAGERAGVPGGKPVRGFRPHLGIAYSNRPQPAAPLIRAVGVLRGRAAVSLPIGHVDLVELRREERVYRWDVLHRVPLPAV
ncbi:2'-5' RNA ligase family protein [Streptacidiphilus sp. EB103A]|uniref:2'-5' RNA ligase family protein n=1 Tax=Streptacidiphilus sp. EB103A TaxID=3156275 RepID=UPI003514D62F